MENAELTERLVHRQVRFDDEHGCPCNLTLLKHVTTLPVQHAVDPSHHLLRTLQREPTHLSD